MRIWALVLWLAVAPSLAAAAPPSAQVRTVPVQQHELTETITAYGRVSPAPEALTTRSAVYSGFVQRLYVTLGEPVQKDDPLLELQTAPSARANYERAKANVRYAREKLARTRELLQQQLATRAEVNAAEQALQTAKANFATEKALGTGQKTQTIKAPFKGIVSQLPVKPGNQVSVGTQLFQLTKRDRLQVALGIEPDEVRRVHAGTPVSVVSLFSNNIAADSRVAQVNAVVDPATRLVAVIVGLNGDQASPFLPGMRIKGLLTLTTKHTLAVPRSAVSHDKKGDYLFVVRGGKARRVDVQSGLQNNGLIGVEGGGLKTGAEAVVEGNHELSDGLAVRQAS